MPTILRSVLAPLFPLVGLVAVGCMDRGASHAPSPVDPAHAPSPVTSAAFATTPAVTPPTATHADAPPKAPSPREQFVAWIRPRLPEGGVVVDDPSAPAPKVMHTVAKTDTAASLAKAYLDLSTVYFQNEYAAAIQKKYPRLVPGAQIEIPALVTEPFDALEKPLGWPADKVMKGVFITGWNAGVIWPATLDRVAAHGMNTVVLDGKDYMGPITYPSKVKLAIELGAVKAPIADLKRAIRFAHARGVRVVMRIACFHDPHAESKAPRLGIQGDWGKVFPMGWLDPTNAEAQQYILDLATEQIEAGADEIQLDYIRFPVHGGLKHAVMPPGKDGARIAVIRDFVHRVHEVTKAHGVSLSLDVFGVTATGTRDDIEMLGQDIPVLAHECEALSPMVYPSHYAPGFAGYHEPGDHPEVIGIGARNAVAKLEDKNGAVIRPWLQAFPLRSPSFGPKYVADEAKQAETNGGTGWLMWSPACEYSAVWNGFPTVKAKQIASK